MAARAKSLGRAQLLDHVDPQLKREVFTIRARELEPQLLGISLTQHGYVKSGTTCKTLYILSIAIGISREFGQDQIVAVEGFQPEVVEAACRQIDQPRLIVLRNDGYRHDVQVDLVAPMKVAPLPRELHEPGGIGSLRRLEDVDISGRTFQTVQLGDDKPAKAVQLGPLGELGIEFAEE